MNRGCATTPSDVLESDHLKSVNFLFHPVWDRVRMMATILWNSGTWGGYQGIDIRSWTSSQ